MFHHKEEKSIHKHNYIYSFLHVNKYFNKIFNDIRIKPNNFYNKNSYFDINNNLYFHSSEKFYPFDITYYSKPLILNASPALNLSIFRRCLIKSRGDIFLLRSVVRISIIASPFGDKDCRLSGLLLICHSAGKSTEKFIAK